LPVARAYDVPVTDPAIAVSDVAFVLDRGAATRQIVNLEVIPCTGLAWLLSMFGTRVTNQFRYLPDTCVTASKDCRTRAAAACAATL
jgi:hypothetical protein